MGMNAHGAARRRAALGLAAAAAGALCGAVRARGAARGRVIVVGGGFAGASCALRLRALDPTLEVEIIDPDADYLTCPMSNAVLVGWRSLDSLIVHRTGLERRGVRMIRERVIGIEPRRRRVRLQGGGSRSYDRLVFAAGIRFLWGRPQGYDEAAVQAMPHAWQAGPQTRLLAAQIAALRPGGVVAISVPAGPMRCPPGPFERASVIASHLSRRNPRAKVLIFDANNQFPRQDAFTAAWRELYPGMIEWVPVVEGGAVERVDPGTMTLYTARGAEHADVINVIPPQAPAQLAVDAGLASDHGWCPVAAGTFESTLVPGVHVIGDACIAAPMPKAASAAYSQAESCARAIVAELGGRRAGPAPLESVCYSLLAPGRALSIHARFEIVDGAIRHARAAEPAPTPTAQDEARNAARWYARIVADAFGA